MRTAVVNAETHIVENVIELEVVSAWPVPEGYYIVQRADADIGKLWDGTEFLDVAT